VAPVRPSTFVSHTLLTKFFQTIVLYVRRSDGARIYNTASTVLVSVVTAFLQVSAATSLRPSRRLPRCLRHLSTPRLPLFFVPCSSFFPVQDDNFFSPRYSPTTLCQMSPWHSKSGSVLVSSSMGSAVSEEATLGSINEFVLLSGHPTCSLATPEDERDVPKDVPRLQWISFMLRDPLRGRPPCCIRW
jgi:hypothetical protein